MGGNLYYTILFLWCMPFCVCDVILSLGTVGSFILPFLRLFSRKRVIINLDGLDDRRAKFNHFSQRVIGAARRLAAKYADVCISDNQGIKDYAYKVYRRDSELIEYGGDNAFPVEDNEKLWNKYGLIKGQYCFKVARVEPENNIEMILQAFAQLPEEKLVLVGNWSRSEFGKRMKTEYSAYKNIMMLNPIYDALEINLLRSNCKIYIHGHSAGGTNPSLVEAMNLHLPIITYGVVYNRETTENQALYFEDAESLIYCIRSFGEKKTKSSGRCDVCNCSAPILVEYYMYEIRTLIFMRTRVLLLDGHTIQVLPFLKSIRRLKCRGDNIL